MHWTILLIFVHIVLCILHFNTQIKQKSLKSWCVEITKVEGGREEGGEVEGKEMENDLQNLNTTQR